MILRHLPEAVGGQPAQADQLAQKITQKGLPWLDIPKFQTYFKRQGQRLWHFLLEAKDLRPSAAVGYRVKKIFGRNAVSATALPAVQPAQIQTASQPEQPDETYYLEKIKAEPKNLQLYNQLGKFYLDSGQPSDARDIFQYLVRHNMTNAEYYARLAQSNYKLKDYGPAVDNYTQSLAIDPAQPNRLYNKGVCQEALGQLNEAAETFKQAIALEPRNIKFYSTLAAALQKAGNRLAAKSILLKAQKLEPFNAEIAEKLKTV
jgi:tetratricopeptide (TPR) repeat protein